MYVDKILLTLNIAVVDPGTFQEFYKCWKLSEVELGQVATLDDLVGSFSEILVKVSQLIGSSVGNGRVVLTRDRQVAFGFQTFTWQLLLYNFASSSCCYLGSIHIFM